MNFLKSISILFLFCLSGCLTNSQAPKAPPAVRCPVIAVEGGQPYLKCQWTTGGEIWRVPIKELPYRKEKYICTTDQSYQDLYNYLKSLDRWIGQNCNK